ncbi:MAG TPA: CoA activase, partial [Deltaproteobacteria bacterium]|nr:CoA activase [Deltaproteobacteria bacterium]
CPLVQSSQYLVKAALGLDERRIVNPTVYLKDEFPALVRQVHNGIFPTLGVKRKKVEAALEIGLAKQQEFVSKLRAIGKEFLASENGEDPIWIISGRPYNLYDERLNLRLGRHLSKLGIKAIPLDFLDLSGVDLSDFPNMYWGLGAKILRTAKLVKATSHFFGVHLTNFSCGADSFIEHFYNHVMGGKPYLLLELDEHSAIAGMMTRVEAFNNVVQNVHQKHLQKPMLKAI